MKKSCFHKIFSAAAVIAAALLTTSCPEPISAPMVALVEDTVAPIINISSPRGGDNFYSSVTVTGIITDDVLNEGDGAGQITSIYYEIANDDFRKGKIDISLDKAVVADTDFGSGAIDFDPVTGEFEFTFSAIEPSKLRDLLSLNITAVDRNSNEITEQLSLVESRGPVIDFGFWDNPDYSGDPITSFDSSTLYIKGTVGNSEYDADNADEIVEIRWSIEGFPNYGGTLDLTDASEQWDESRDAFRINNNLENFNYFTYYPATRTFEISTRTVDTTEGPQFITVDSTDLYGHTTEETNTIARPADFNILDNTDITDKYYFSPNADALDKVISIPFYLTDPSENITFDQFQLIEFYLQPSSGGAILKEWTDYTYTNESAFESYFSATSGSSPTIYFNIDFTTYDANLTGVTSSVALVVTATDNESTTDETDYIILRDAGYPDITVNSFGTSSYTSQVDNLPLSFNVSDNESGIESINNVSIYIDNSIPDDGNITPAFSASGDYNIGYTGLTSLTSTASGQDIGYSISVYDIAGNPGIEENLSALTFYGPFNNSDASFFYADSITTVSDNQNGITYWAKPGDTITVEFTGIRDLNGGPSLTIGGQTADVTYSSEKLCSASITIPAITTPLTNNQSVVLSEGEEVPVRISVEDMAGNSGEYNYTSSIKYDCIAPNPPNSISYTGSFSNNYINSTDMSGPIYMRVTYDIDAGDPDIDTVELHLNSAEGILVGSEIYYVVDELAPTSYVDIEINKTNLGDNGDKTIVAVITDPAGNNSEIGSTISVDVDTTPPAKTVTINSIDADSGTSDDFITNDDDGLTIDATLSTALSTGEILQYSTDNSNWSDISSSVSSTDVSYTDTSLTTTKTIYMRVTDEAGNSGSTTSQLITIDTTPPTTTVTIESIDADSGTPGDFLTNDDNGLTIDATLSTALSTGEILQYSTDNSNWSNISSSVNSTDVSYTDNSLTSTKTIYMRVIDGAGNIGASASQLITIDTISPTTTVTIDSITDDTGTSSSDFLTSDDDGLTIGATLSTALSIGEILQYSTDNSNWTNISSSVSSTAVSHSDTSLTSTKTIYMRVTDEAGNSGSTASQLITIDTTPPAKTVTINSIDADSGTSDDFITNDDDGLTIDATLSTALSTGEILQYSTDNSNWSDISSSVSNKAVSHTDLSLTTTKTIYMRVTDEAGNSGSTASQLITIDISAPLIETIPSGTVEVSGSAGYSTTPVITDDTSLTYSWTVYVDNDSDNRYDNGETIYSSQTGLSLNLSADQTISAVYNVDFIVTDSVGLSSEAYFELNWDHTKSLLFTSTPPTLVTKSSKSGSSSIESSIKTYNFESNTGGQYSTEADESLTEMHPTSYSRVNTYDGKMYTPPLINNRVKSVETTGKITGESNDPTESEINPVELSSEIIDTSVVLASSAPEAASATITKNAAADSVQTVDPEQKRNGAAALLFLIPGAAAAAFIFRKRQL